MGGTWCRGLPASGLGGTCPGTPTTRVNRMTDWCKILPCSKLRLRAVIKLPLISR